MISGLNLTFINENKNKILELTYDSKYLEEDSLPKNTTPQIKTWKFTSFTEFYFDLEINFINQLYVSNSILKDTISIKALNNKPFVSKKNGYKLNQNYTTEFNVPRQAKNDKDQI